MLNSSEYKKWHEVFVVRACVHGLELGLDQRIGRQSQRWADKRVCTQGKGSQLYFVLTKLLNVKMTHGGNGKMCNLFLFRSVLQHIFSDLSGSQN